MIELYDHQVKALDLIRTGSILCGGVGSGKSRTALTYFFTKVCEGYIGINKPGYEKAKKPRDLYIITTAKKRDSGDWEKEFGPFIFEINNIKVKVDSWNNIAKYVNVYGAFFIFDEQRLVGSGKWVRSFYKIAKKNQWILLSATPGDAWKDYIPVFIANGFFHSKWEFYNKHVIRKPYVKWVQIEGYRGIYRLEQLKKQIIVYMDFERKTERHYDDIYVGYDKKLYDVVWKERWNPFEDCPIDEVSKLFSLLRMIPNTDQSRIDACSKLINEVGRCIVFYNFDYELDILRKVCKDLDIKYKEWNGHNHHPLPTGKRWVYLVQYTAGSEGWNCITCNHVIFYSLNYSYKIFEQASGRIDRLNTPYKDLFYYVLKSHAPIDNAISKSLKDKEEFNEKRYLG